MTEEETPKTQQTENSEEITPNQQERKDSTQTELSDANDPLNAQEKDNDNPLNHDNEVMTTDLCQEKRKKKKGTWFKSLFGRKRAMSVEEQDEARKNIATSVVGALK